MTLGEFKEKTKDLPDDIEIVKEYDNGYDDATFNIVALGKHKHPYYKNQEYWTGYEPLNPRDVIVI